MSDNPNVRNATLCPLCHGEKSRGLIACWPCFRKHDMRNGNRWAEERIAAYDEMLEFSNFADSMAENNSEPDPVIWTEDGPQL